MMIGRFSFGPWTILFPILCVPLLLSL